MPYIPAGTYRAKPTALMLAESKNGNAYIKGIFEPIDMVGVGLYWTGMLSEKARDITFKALRVCGFRGTDLTSIDFDPQKEVLIVVENEEYDNKQHSKVRWVNDPNNKKVENTLDPAKAKAFAAAMRGAIIAFDQKNRPAAPVSTTTETNTDDIPF